MASECCLSLTKYFLFLFNLVFFFLGSLLLSLGLWILLSYKNIFALPPPYISISLFSYLLIISGSVTMSMGFFGCLGSLKTVKCMLATYFILLTVLLAAQIVGGVLFYTQKTELSGLFKQHTLGLIQSLRENDSSLHDFKQTLEYIQQKNKCCGWNGKDDWEDYVSCSCYYQGNATVIETNVTEAPNACTTCSSNLTLLKSTCEIYDQGCSKTIKEWLDNNLHFILVVILAIFVVEICGMILSMCLYKEGSVDYKTILY